MARKVNRIASEETAHVQITMFKTVPHKARKSETLDNGREHRRHRELKTTCNIYTYFCHPYASYERGTNENTNGLLKIYSPIEIVTEQLPSRSDLK